MTYYGSKDLAAAFRTVRKNTVTIAEEVPADKYDFRATPDTRTIGETLAHLAVSTGFQRHVHESRLTDMKTVNFPTLFQKFTAEEAALRSKPEILAALKAEGDAFAAFLESLPEAVLAEQVAMGPMTDKASKSRFEMLLGAKEHEMHHRGQLMTLQRMIGQTPHLTRQMQERMAQTMAAAQQSRA
jgi:uncharacterized damage-inducible protein DinB